MECIQLDFFLTNEESEIEYLRKTITHIGDSNNRVRKKLFGEHGKLNKRITELEERMLIIERNLCKK